MLLELYLQKGKSMGGDATAIFFAVFSRWGALRIAQKSLRRARNQEYAYNNNFRPIFSLVIFLHTISAKVGFEILLRHPSFLFNI